MSNLIEQLPILNCSQLREVAKSYSIKGRWDMSKGELIKAIEQKLLANTPKEKEAKTPNWEGKMNYIKTVNPGVLVAFKLPDGKVLSGKMINRSVSRKVLKLEDKQGKEYIVPFSDVLWVKTGRIWPKGVYELLKGCASSV